MKKAWNIFNRIEDAVIGLLLPLMCAVIFIATVCRIVGLPVITWSEELARYCMIWIVFIGVSAAARSGSNFSVTAVIGFLPKSVANVVAVLRIILVVGFNLFTSVYAFDIIQLQLLMGQVTPSLKWPMWIIYAAIPIGCIGMAIRYTVHTVQEMRGITTEEGGVDI